MSKNKQRKRDDEMNELQNEKMKIAELIMQGIEAWFEAGRILVKVLDEGETLESVSDSCGLSKDVLCRFEQIGRSQLYPKILASTSDGARALSLCGYSEQKKYCEEPVPVLVETETGFETLNIELDNMTSRQVKQAFNRGHVRTLSEQRAWLEDQKAKEKARKFEDEPMTTPYIIRGKTILFRKGAELDKDELIALLGRVK